MDSLKLDDAATYALNAMPGDEADNFLRHLTGELEDEVQSFRRVSVALTEGLPDIVPAASPELWEKISVEAGIVTNTPIERNKKRPRSFRPGLLMAAAAAFIAVVAVGAMSLSTIRDTSSDPRSMAVAAAASTDALAVTLASPAGEGTIEPEVVITTDGSGYVIADSLPRLDDGRTYQLWLIVDDRVISAALLGPDPDVVQFRAEGEISGIAISEEVAGGVVVSEVAPTAIWLSDSV